MDEIVILIRKLMRNLCLNEAPCKIYSILALSEKPMSIKEISEMTGYSPTMIYSSIKELKENDLIERVKEGKNIAYTANINFIDVFERRRRKIMDEFLEPLSNVDLTKYKDNSRIKEIRRYAITMQEYFRKINELKNGEIVVKK